MKKIVIGILTGALFFPVLAYAQTPIYPSTAPGAVQPATTYTGSYPSSAASQVTAGLSACQNLTSISSVASCALGIINLIIPIIVALTVVWTIYSSFELARTEGDDRKKWGWAIFYGLLGIFLMISVYGLVAIFTGTFGFGGTSVNVPNLNNTIQLSQ